MKESTHVGVRKYQLPKYTNVILIGYGPNLPKIVTGTAGYSLFMYKEERFLQAAYYESMCTRWFRIF
jgi:hypothetical protein